MVRRSGGDLGGARAEARGVEIVVNKATERKVDQVYEMQVVDTVAPNSMRFVEAWPLTTKLTVPSASCSECQML